MIDADRQSEAVELYQLAAVGLPEEVVLQLREAPFRQSLESIAHTLIYDALVIGDATLPDSLIAAVEMPTLVVGGSESPPFLRSGAAFLAAALPAGIQRTLIGESHHINPAPTAAAVAEFLAST